MSSELDSISLKAEGWKSENMYPSKGSSGPRDSIELVWDTHLIMKLGGKFEDKNK